MYKRLLTATIRYYFLSITLITNVNFDTFTTIYVYLARSNHIAQPSIIHCINRHNDSFYGVQSNYDSTFV